MQVIYSDRFTIVALIETVCHKKPCILMCSETVKQPYHTFEDELITVYTQVLVCNTRIRKLNVGYTLCWPY